MASWEKSWNRRLRVEQLEDRRVLATITVSNLTDVVNGDTSSPTTLIASPGVDGISLREAIAAANGTFASDEIQFAPSLFASGPKIITLTGGDLDIMRSVTINGPGSGILTIDASGNDPTPLFNNGDGSRVFTIDYTVLTIPPQTTPLTNTISGVRLTGGDVGPNDLEGRGGAIWNNQILNLSDVIVAGNAAAYLGGGMYSSSMQASFMAKVTATDCVFTGNNGSQFGGGAAIQGAADITNCTFSLNTASDGGGVLFVSKLTPDSAFIVRGSSFSQNVASGNGGGFTSSAAVMTIENSTFHDNQAYNGGGIFCRDNGGSLLITGSTITNNRVLMLGGGIYTAAPTAVAASRISGNSAANAYPRTYDPTTEGPTMGGGIFAAHDLALTSCLINANSVTHEYEAKGGGIFAGGAVTSISNSTISANIASVPGGNVLESGGGGIFANGALSLLNSTVTGNAAVRAPSLGHGGGIYQAASLSIANSIIAGNVGQRPDIYGFFISVNYSLIGITSGSEITPASGEGNLLDVNPQLGPLANNGGTLPTHALLGGSPAINAGNPAAIAGVDGLPSNDQRGNPYARIASGRIDMGAFEVQTAPAASADFDGDGDRDGADFLAWQRGVGLTGAAATFANGNADLDNDIDGADLAIWKSTFGLATGAADEATTAAAAPASVSSSPASGGALTPATIDAAMAYVQWQETDVSRPRYRPKLVRGR